MKSKSNQTIKFIALIVLITLACGQFSIGILTPTPNVTQTHTPDLTISQTYTPYITLTPWETPTEIPYVTPTPVPALTYTPYVTFTPPVINFPIITNTPYSHETILQAAATATRIQFQPGTTYFNFRNREIAANSTDEFILRIMEGQTLSVGHPHPTKYEGVDNFTISLYRVEDGAVLAQDAYAWGEYVPKTQDYLIVVSNWGEATAYSFDVNAPRRITFEEGATTATIQGVLIEANINTYVVHAEEGQSFTVTVISPDDIAVLTVFGKIEGSPYCRSMFLSTYCTITGPITQDYIIRVESRTTILGTAFPSTPVNYTLEIAFSD